MIGISLMILALGIGAAFAGAALYAYYDYRQTQNETRVDACMTTRVVSCSPNDAVEKATELMRQNQIRRVPVVNEGGELQGIVSLGDVVERAAIKSTQTHETLKCVSVPTDAPSKPRAESTKVA